MDGWIRLMDGWIDGWIDGWMDGWIDGWMDGWMEGWMDGYVACQAPLSMEFPRQEYWSGQLFPFLWDLPDPELEPKCPAQQVNSLPSEPPGKHIDYMQIIQKKKKKEQLHHFM